MEKIIALAQKTGERVLVMDRQTGEVFVLLTLNAYERLAGAQVPVRDLTEDEMLDRINQEIALWQAANKDEVASDALAAELVEDDEEEESYYLEEV